MVVTQVNPYLRISNMPIQDGLQTKAVNGAKPSSRQKLKRLLMSRRRRRLLPKRRPKKMRKRTRKKRRRRRRRKKHSPKKPNLSRKCEITLNQYII